MGGGGPPPIPLGGPGTRGDITQPLQQEGSMEAIDDEAATAAVAGNGDNRPLQEGAANMSAVACGDGGEAPAAGAQPADGKAHAIKR